MFNRTAFCGVGVACAVIAASPVVASTDGVFNVAQPLISYDGGLFIGFEAYAGYSPIWPATLVTLTCAENSTRIVGGSGGPVRTMGTEDRNAASVTGLTIRHVPKSEFVPHLSKDEPYFGDTLRVVLEIPEWTVASEEKRMFGWSDRVSASLREVVCATLECTRINAVSQRANLRYLDVQIDGWAAVADLAGVYPLDEIPPIPDRQYGYDEEGKPQEEICSRE